MTVTPGTWSPSIAGSPLESFLRSPAAAVVPPVRHQADLYVALQRPNGQLLFCRSFQPTQTPWLTDFSVSPSLEVFDFELINELIDDEPGGSYSWFAAMVPVGGDPMDPAALLSLDDASTSLNK